MKKRRLFLFLLCCVLICNARAQQFVEDSMKVDGYMRRFDLFLPEGIKSDAPLVFYLHGYGGGIQRNNPMIETASREGFAVCIPQGLKDPKGKASWNVGYPFQEGWEVDDVKSLCKMAAYVQKRYHLSRENTFLTGMSNGGEMCYLMAYSKQETFKAVAPIAGLTMVWMYRELEASRPIPLFEIHGTEDRTSEWTGDLDNKGGWGAYMPVPLAVDYWVAKNRCMKEETERVESLNKENGRYIIKHRFTDSPLGCDVWLYEVVGGKHSTHTEDIRTGDEIWSFFKKYVKREAQLLKTALSQITFSKRDFADTIKVRVLDGAVIVPVEIEGQTRHLLFDTGGQHGAWYSPKEDWMKPLSDDSITVSDINKKEQKQLMYRAPSIKLGNLVIGNYPLVHGEGMIPYSCNVFNGALGFDLVAKGLSFKLDTKDSLLIVTDRKGFFAEEEKDSPFVKYKPINRTKPVVQVQSPIGEIAAVFDTGAIRVWLDLPQKLLDRWLDRYPKKRKDVDALTVQTDSTINTHIGLHGLSNDTIAERFLHFPSIEIGNLTVNDLYVSTACHSMGIGTALLRHTSVIIDAPRKHLVFLPHDQQTEISVGNRESKSLSFVPAEAGDSLGVLKAIVRTGSTAYQKGIRTGDYLIEVNGTPITTPCTYMQMEGKDKETPMKFRTPDGIEKLVTLNRTY